MDSNQPAEGSIDDAREARAKQPDGECGFAALALFWRRKNTLAQ